MVICEPDSYICHWYVIDNWLKKDLGPVTNFLLWISSTMYKSVATILFNQWNMWQNDNKKYNKNEFERLKF